MQKAGDAEDTIDALLAFYKQKGIFSFDLAFIMCHRIFYALLA